MHFTHLHSSVVCMKATVPLHHEPGAVTYAREKAGLSKTDLARQLGVSLSLISMIEAGTRSATPARLPKIADVLNCPVVFLERKRAAVTLAAAQAERATAASAA